VAKQLRKERAAAGIGRRRAGGRWRGKAGHATARAATADTQGREERPRERAKAAGRTRGAGLGRHLGEGEKRDCTAGLNPGKSGAGTVETEEQQ
jgi:hypothetical protein